jgi:RES domain
MNIEIQETIERINRLAKEGAEVDKLAGEIRKLLAIAPRSIASIYEPGVIVYRATKHHRSVPTRIEEIWYPPPEKTQWNRANRPKRPMFYCTSDPDCALREIGADIDNTVVFATWRTTGKMMLHDLGFSSQVLSRPGSCRSLSEHHAKFYREQLDDKGKAVRDFFALAFTEPSPQDYRLTVAVAEAHSDPDFAGILYPSVAKAANTDNLALLPSFVHSGLNLVKAQVFQVDQKDPDGRVSGDVICALERANDHGELSWSYGGKSENLPPKAGKQIRAGDPLLAQTSGEVEIDGKRYQLEPGFSIRVEGSTVIVRDVQNRVIKPL